MKRGSSVHVHIPSELAWRNGHERGYAEEMVHLRPADYMVLYTDGLCEARTSAGELFSIERVGDLLAERPDAARATEAAVSFGQQDDITVLTLTRLAVGEESRTMLVAPVLAPA